MSKSLLSFIAIIIFPIAACLAQTNSLDSEHTQEIFIPMTAGGYHAWSIKKIHLHKGDTLVAHLDHISNFQESDNHSLLTSKYTMERIPCRGMLITSGIGLHVVSF